MHRERLAAYGARLRTIDGERVVEMVDPNDNARRRFQYRRDGDGLARRVDDSPWQPFAPHELSALRAARGRYHPILDPLGL